MNRYFKYILFSTFVASTLFAEAKTVDLDSLAAMLKENNPSLKLMRQKITADESLMSSENVLSAPEVDFTHLWGDKSLGNKWSVEVTQSFDWPGIYSARKANIADATSLANTEYLIEYNKLYKELIESVNTLVYCNKLIAIIKDMSERLSSTSVAIKKAFDNGEVSILDVRKVEFQLFSLNNKLADLYVEQSKALSDIYTLNGGRKTDFSDIDSYPNFELNSLDYYLTENQANNMSGKLANEQINALQSEAKVARMSRYPGFSVGYNHEYEMGDKFNGFHVGVTLPFYSGKKREKALETMSMAYREQSQQAVDSRNSEIVQLHMQASTLMERLNSSKQLFNDKSDYPILLKKAFDGGEINMIDYLLEMNYYIEASKEYLDTEYNYYNTLTQLKFNL